MVIAAFFPPEVSPVLLLIYIWIAVLILGVWMLRGGERG